MKSKYFFILIFLASISIVSFKLHNNSDNAKSKSDFNTEKIVKIEHGLMKEKQIVPGLKLFLKIEKPSKDSNKLLISAIVKNVSLKKIELNKISDCERPVVEIYNVGKFYNITRNTGFECPFESSYFTISPNDEFLEQKTLDPKFEFNKKINEDFAVISRFSKTQEKIEFNLDDLN